MSEKLTVSLADMIDDPLRDGIKDLYRRAAEAAVRGEIVAIKCGDETVAILGPTGILGPGMVGWV